ncbi:MAG: serine/threonine-protein kinase, partial [Planctomycetota bacterium]
MANGVPSRIGSYEITREIGRGGMDVVYLARDTKLDRDVAIKTLPDKMAGDRDRLARFQREIKLVASLNHPNILTVHDVGREDDVSFVVTELLEGEDLRQRLSRGALEWPEMLRISLELVGGLAVAHERGIIHRDLKPANVFLAGQGLVKILDFGLARRDTADTSLDAAAPTVSLMT